MYNYNLWLKATNRQDNKQNKLDYLKRYLQYVKMINSKGKVR